MAGQKASSHLSFAALGIEKEKPIEET